MGIVLQSLPKRSSQLVNKGASSLIKFFESDGDVLYLYGPAGSGKTMALDMLVREYGYEIVKAGGPFTSQIVDILASTALFMMNRKLVLVDVVGMKASDLKLLAEGVWGETKLVLVGEEFPKKSPIRTHFMKQDYKFIPVKFFPFQKEDITGCLSLYAMEMGVSVSYEIINKIADSADGDMRAARISLRSLIHSQDEEAVDIFLPFSDVVYNNEVKKLFSGNRGKAKEAIETFTPFVSILIMRENILKFLPERDDLIRYLYTYANLDIDTIDGLIDLACYLGKNIKTFTYVYYRRPTSLEIPKVNADCSDGKKILYFRQFERLMNK